MSKGTVLFLDTVHPLLYEGLQEQGYQCSWEHETPWDLLKTKLEEAKGIVIRSRYTINSDFLAICPSLSWIARSGSGLENIDLVLAKKKGITVHSAPEGNAPAVAEHVLALILSLFNHINTSDQEVRKGLWNREPNRGIELGGKTVGIIGYGHTGKATAQRLLAFGASVVAYDKYVSGFASQGVQEVTLKALKETADIISFHVPYNKETHHYFNAKFLHSCSKKIWLINSSRGKVIETAAVVEGLTSGELQGAGLDVLEYESSSFDNKAIQSFPNDFQELIKFKNTILTPHVAGWTEESYQRLSEVLLFKISKQKI